jgi:stage V sporulation protein AD
MTGKQSIIFNNPPYIIAASSIAGKKEGDGPLGKNFDLVWEDPMIGKQNWEEAESELMKEAAQKALMKAELKSGDIRYLIGGDLLGQLIATSFGIAELGIPLFGIYGACSTMGEAMQLGAVLVDGGYAERVMAITSSHFAGAEKQFRMPLDYGNQRPYSASWTVTGSGAAIISNKNTTKNNNEPDIVISGITTGKIVDYGIKDSMNMGAAMAPAAADTVSAHFEDTGLPKDYYDMVVTGDLGQIGSEILDDLLTSNGIRIGGLLNDCGRMIYDKTQDAHAGGSGCGCSAAVFAGFLFDRLKNGKINKLLFVPTGALLSPTSVQQGETIPCIAHALAIETGMGG